MRSGIQQSTPEIDPLVRVTIFDDPTTYYYYSEGGNSGSNEYVVRVFTHEMPWGGEYTILLDNSLGVFNTVDFEGRKVNVYWSFIGETGSTMCDIWVHRQQLVSMEGKLLLQLECIDFLGFMSLMSGAKWGAFWNQYWQDDDYTTGRQLPVTGGEVPASIISALNSHYDQTIKTIVTTTVEDCSRNSSDVAQVTVQWDDEADDTLVNSEKPIVGSDSPRNLVAQAMQPCKSYLLWKNDMKLHQICPDAHASVYTYNLGLYHYSTVTVRENIIPNRVVVWWLDGDTWTKVTAPDSGSYGRLNFYVDKHYLTEFDTIGSLNEAEAQAKADGMLVRIQQGKAEGEIVAPMHCAQELYDAVTINDDRYSPTKQITGYVFGITRVYDRGIYQIKLELGGVTTQGYTPPSGTPIRVVNIPQQPPADVFDWDEILPQAIQGYDLEGIDFSATDWNTVAWTGGYIHFYDGTTVEVSAGNTGDISTDTRRYIWFDLQDSAPLTLHIGTEAEYLVAFDEDVGLLCVCQRGTTSDIDAWFLPSRGKTPLITADLISMTSLKEKDLGGGMRYQLILDTQIEAGKIKISSETNFDSGYDPTSKITTYYQASAPTGDIVAGDLWMDSDDGNKLYRYSGASWIELQDDDIASALYNAWFAEQVANGAQDTADEKAHVWFQTSAPTGLTYGDMHDMWVDTDDGNKVYRWTGYAWSETKWNLDNLADGSTWKRVRSTCLYDGYIELNQHTEVAGNEEWYDNHGVIMDSGKGIRLYGTDMAFGTFANASDARAGTNYKCKMDNTGRIIAGSGAVILDNYGITIDDESDGSQWLKFKNGATTYGQLYCGLVSLIVKSTNKNLQLESSGASTILKSSSNVYVDADNFDLDYYGCNFKPNYFNQSSQPAMVSGEMIIWRDSDDGKVYLVFRDALSGYKKEELT